MPTGGFSSRWRCGGTWVAYLFAWSQRSSTGKVIVFALNDYIRFTVCDLYINKVLDTLHACNSAATFV